MARILDYYPTMKTGSPNAFSSGFAVGAGAREASKRTAIAQRGQELNQENLQEEKAFREKKYQYEKKESERRFKIQQEQKRLDTMLSSISKMPTGSIGNVLPALMKRADPDSETYRTLEILSKGNEQTLKDMTTIRNNYRKLKAEGDVENAIIEAEKYRAYDKDTADEWRKDVGALTDEQEAERKGQAKLKYKEILEAMKDPDAVRADPNMPLHKSLIEQDYPEVVSEILNEQDKMKQFKEKEDYKASLKGNDDNITGQFMTDKGVTVGYSDETGAVAYVGGGKVPYDENIHGKKRDTRGTYRESAVMNRIVDKFNADPAMRTVEKMDHFSNLITDVAASDNPIGHASLETLMARASGEVGNLSEADKKPFGGSRALTEKIKQYFSELYEGKKTNENLKFISDLAETFRKAGREKERQLAKKRAKQYASVHKKQFGWTAEYVFSVLSPDSNYNGSEGGESLPEQAIKSLTEGVVTTFGNGQKWTLKEGQSQRVD